MLFQVRAGELVNVSLIEGGQDVLRHAAIAVCGKEVVKPVLKKLNSCEFDEGTFPVFWLCLKLWSKMASSEEISEGYLSNAEELVSVAEGGETNIKILLDQLLGLLSQPMKYHRTVVYFVYVHLLSHLKKEHVAHIVETLMMDDEELADGDGSDGNSSNDDEEMEEDADAEPESENDDDENIDPETIDRLESALGKAAVKRKHDAVDEEESDESEVDDSEMFAMDERLAAAFKAMAPKKENKVAAQLASAFRLKLADLLLFTLSSQSTAPQVKACLIIPLLKLAKLQLKQDAEGQCARKTIGLLNIVSRLKKIELSDKKVINLLNELISEGTGISNPTLIAAVAALSAFIFSLGISSEGTCSEAVLKEFLGLFERFMSQEDGLIGCELAIAAVIKHPEFFVSSANVFLKAGFNDEYRVFRKTEALLCLAGMMSKGVLSKAAIEKSTVKGIAKASSEYLLAALAQPETIKPRYFASVMKLLQCTASSVGDDLKPTLQKHLRMEEIAENEEAWKNVHKKVNSACQQVCGKSSARVIDGILKSVV
ncbi:hypothetical protein Q1695_014907 [Nippostrongylus brasiliensis]|nr:hypothetical protein Q1695_014907 [Nippostrongylus brasiliensis]